MKSLQTLPENYREIASVDLKENKKEALLVNGLSVVLMLLLVVLMDGRVHFIRAFLSAAGNFLSMVVLCISMFVYIVLHEAVHGIAMKLCGSEKVRFGFNVLYAYAGCDDYYDKKSYIFIALAPLVLLGIVIMILTRLVVIEWFWIWYFLQIINVVGAAGDIYVSIRFGMLPGDILVRDWGANMKAYIKE